MFDEHSTEQLETESRKAQKPEKEEYTPRPRSQLILAWVLIGIVVAGFLGMCYWMAFGRF